MDLMLASAQVMRHRQIPVIQLKCGRTRSVGRRPERRSPLAASGSGVL
jgi:hypothetical protein